ncbi:hypothetical protein [Candidatus Vesicomyidisocius calyptogenae]|uniref:Uncharacterized protein n=1 Tax=Vesicomyosocius okutanii subsp. Calyptogena okutanii (strain HA) TaxID=412965 RepID=A5CXR6_VESOH|nr:hypothetical protein [Candidatus Vesicomyosocius okutanii]BAF61254.1 hypothetical protein COSY_0120 [Candidatus Vesicomyosocius okutanii]
MLNTEDILKLNVLIKTSIAIRIDTYKLIVVGLNTQFKEQMINLSLTSDSDAYIKEVKELLINQVMGTMKGKYLSYLKHWSRIGQVTSSNLSLLLKLGEVEAVIAVSNAIKFDKNLLKLTWWCATNTANQAEIGRLLLTKDFVINTNIGRNIAKYLLELLPFIHDIEQLIDTTNLILQKGLINKTEKAKLWEQGQKKTAFLVGFIERMNLKDIYFKIHTDINIISFNFKHQDLQLISNKQTQLLLKTTINILKKINQETILYRTLDVLGQYLYHPSITFKESIVDITNQANVMVCNIKDEREKLFARMLLAGVSERLVVSTISAHRLTGSAIRRKLINILSPIQKALDVLTTP